MKRILLITLTIMLPNLIQSQNSIPIDTTHWNIQAKSYVIENYKGKEAIYIQNGGLFLKDVKFLNGTIEFDIFLKEGRMYPGVFFRGVNRFQDGEQWFIRTHLSGKEDGNQAAPAIKGITPWQLYFGPKYSFTYDYKYDDWTHVKVVVNNDKAQVFLDYSEKPNLSWTLFNEPQEGGLMIRGGSIAMYIADIKVDKKNYELVNFNPIKRTPIAGLIEEWDVSDMFEEKLLDNPNKINAVIENRKWNGKIKVEEGTAANISRVQLLRNGEPGETVFTKIKIHSDKDQIKLFNFGYSDRVVAILNGTAIYRGTNGWRSRDYRYLGTIGLFDGIYLNLKKGNNTLLMAVSENFGGWLITGKFENESGIKIIK
ncbi:hypothetical protein [Flavivirga spongiicola]|uniref:DUF1080 domain-containing protein n=1 Tax=Flavivirga spongiicola TaxID=421621 RepID=A0ABU7XYU4_9FLAO|nr:hypothetical protein [Flavivirga sp. MEBiC05379]MDO5980610.1 hypothetical protein [Flavivirga sp. MEBiC05379]